MQFSNTPPADGSQAEQVVLDANKNIVAAVKVPVQDDTEKEVVKAGSPSPYSPKGMKKVIDDAKGVEQLLKQRDEDQQKMLNNL